MARANLVVSAELRDAFVQGGKQDPPVRWLKAELADVEISLVDQGPAGAEAEQDLEVVKQSAMSGSTPCFVLFNLTPGAAEQGWVLVAFVPDSSKVRSRMLYASGQDDVKRALGYSNFKGSLHVTSAEDLTFGMLVGLSTRHLGDQPLTEAEILAKEEVAQMASPSEARANAMGMVPFTFTDDLNEKLEKFNAGECNLVEAKLLDDENVGLGKATSGEALTSASICPDEPRFYLVRQAATTQNVYFVFSCPEGTKIRLRMTYSTCKATFTHHLEEELGIKVTKVFEIGDPADVDDMIKLHDTPDANAGKIVQQNFSKPSRPGRGKARVITKKKP